MFWGLQISGEWPSNFWHFKICHLETRSGKVGQAVGQVFFEIRRRKKE